MIMGEEDERIHHRLQHPECVHVDVYFEPTWSWGVTYALAGRWQAPARRRQNDQALDFVSFFRFKIQEIKNSTIY
jgi:hypothetical protein